MMMSQVNLDQARFNMVEQQIRTWEVLEESVLDLLMDTPRDAFVPDRFRSMAYADIAIPLAHGEQMMHPKVEAHALQALNIKPSDRILEIGTGSGYLTALLAKSGQHVVSVDLHDDLQHQAANNLKAHGIENVTLEQGDGLKGWPEQGPYDVIVLTGSVSELPEELKAQLNPGGRLFAVIGHPPAMTAFVFTRLGDIEWEQKALFETDLAPLVGAAKPKTFEF